MSPRKRASTLGAALCGLALSCGGVDPIRVPVSINYGLDPIDVEAFVLEGERLTCDDPDAWTCFVLRAIDELDGALADPPRLPDEIPTRIAVFDAEGEEVVVDVEQWVRDTGLLSEFRFAHLTPIDLRDQLPTDKPALVRSVEIDEVFVRWPSNTLTFPTVALDVYVGEGGLPADDPLALVDAGKLEHIGTIPPQAAGDTKTRRKIQFSEDGREVMVDYLRDLEFSLAVVLPSADLVELGRGGTPNTVRRPGGRARAVIEGRAFYVIDGVTAAGVAGVL